MRDFDKEEFRLGKSPSKVAATHNFHTAREFTLVDAHAYAPSFPALLSPNSILRSGSHNAVRCGFTSAAFSTTTSDSLNNMIKNVFATKRAN